jgi:hypothetical protein
MIPKAAGGTRPRDQRPITMQEVLYQLWSKGIIMEWTPALQRELLGPWAMEYRAGCGTLHLAQLLANLIHLQRRRGQELWLASFNAEKVFDSLPSWAVFRTMQRAGIASEIVTCSRHSTGTYVVVFATGRWTGQCGKRLTAWHRAVPGAPTSSTSCWRPSTVGRRRPVSAC